MDGMGWVKIHRKLQFSDMFQSLTAKQRDVMIQLILLANHEPHEWEWKGKVFKVKRGQCITSLESIKKYCASDVSLQNIRTAIVKLEKWQFLTNESTKTGRLIVVLNYERYQQKDEPVNKAPNKQLTDSQQTPNKQLTTNKNDIKNDLKNDIEIKWLEQFSWIESIERDYKEVQSHVRRESDFVKNHIKLFLTDQKNKEGLDRIDKQLKSHFVSYITKYAKENTPPRIYNAV